MDENEYTLKDAVEDAVRDLKFSAGYLEGIAKSLHDIAKRLRKSQEKEATKEEA